MSASPRHFRRLVALVAATLLVGGLVSPVAADGPTFTLVASGLNSPRGVAVAPNGAIYVAEAGVGGDDCRTIPGAGDACFGTTGSITRIWKGQQTSWITGLPSIVVPPEEAGSPPEALGPAGIDTLGNGNIEFTLGIGSVRDLWSDVPAAQLLGWSAKASAAGIWKPMADITAYEFAYNPHPTAIDSDPFGIEAVPGGALVADSAGNDVFWTDRHGNVSLLAVFPDRMVPLPFPPFTDVPMESVPTAITVGPDGAYYVGELTGFPFPPGEANVYRLVPGQAPTVYATGFTNIMDMEFAPDGTLYVAEIVHEGLLSGSVDGAIEMAPPGGGAAVPVITTGLPAVGGLAIGKDGSLYVSTGTVFPGGGQVWRIEL